MEISKKKPYIKDGKAYSPDGVQYSYSVVNEDGKLKWKELDGTAYQTKKGIQSPWLLGKDLAHRPGNINKRGATKTVSSIINRLKEDDYVEIDKSSMLKLYKMFFNTPINELKKIAAHQDTPLAAVTIIQLLLDDKTKLKAWTQFQEWTMGKAPEEVNITRTTDVTQVEEDAILKVIGSKY